MLTVDAEAYAEKFAAVGEPIEIVGSVTEREIAAVEHALGVHLRGDYRTYVEKFGCVRVLEVPTNGIYSNEPTVESGGTLLGDTLRLRAEFGLPQQYIVIKTSEDEFFVCIDLSGSAEPEVVSIDPRKAFQRSKLARCFDEYLREDLDAALEAIE